MLAIVRGSCRGACMVGSVSSRVVCMATGGHENCAARTTDNRLVTTGTQVARRADDAFIDPNLLHR